jgi:hypothetical protein
VAPIAVKLARLLQHYHYLNSKKISSLFIYLNKGNEGQLTASDTCLYIIEKCCGKNIKILENTEKAILIAKLISGQQACEAASENMLTVDVLTGRVVVLVFNVIKQLR